MELKSEQPKAVDIMVQDVVTATPEMDLEQCTRLLLEHGVSNAPVITSQPSSRELVGFISERDCLEFFSNELFYGNPDANVGSMMKRHPVCVSPDTDIFTLASIFIQHGYRHVPVVEGSELVGIISRRDVLRGLSRYRGECSKEEAALRWPPDLSQLANLRFIGKVR